MSEKKESLPTVSLREFARIVGVDMAAVSRAAKAGQRLTSASVKRDAKGVPSIVLAMGCFEWISNKDHRKDREPGDDFDPDKIDPNEIMETSQSLRMQRHYEALNEKLNFEREAGRLISIDKFRTEAFTAARSVRDSLLYVPNESEVELRRLIFGFLRESFGEKSVDEHSKKIEEMGLSFRQFQKSSITKALRDLANERLGTESLSEMP
jgi:hypothetical protein